MGTLSTELGTVAGRISGRPRVYADANVPAGLVSFMRRRLGWDVLFVIEHDDLRRARDGEHYRMARQLRRTLVTLDRDYLDERGFPSAEGPGVLIVSAPDETGLAKLLERVDAVLFRPAGAAGRQPAPDLPLEGQKLQVHPDWMIPAGGRRRRRR
jgi:predicted nuclease of predicted toxin-antitoxin system